MAKRTSAPGPGLSGSPYSASGRSPRECWTMRNEAEAGAARRDPCARRAATPAPLGLQCERVPPANRGTPRGAPPGPWRRGGWSMCTGSLNPSGLRKRAKAWPLVELIWIALTLIEVVPRANKYELLAKPTNLWGRASWVMLDSEGSEEVELEIVCGHRGLLDSPNHSIPDR